LIRLPEPEGCDHHLQRGHDACARTRADLPWLDARLSRNRTVLAGTYEALWRIPKMMSPDIEEFIEMMGRQLEEQGAPRIAGRMFGYLMMMEEPESLDQLADKLQVSRTSISTNARLLVDWGLVHRATFPGDRRDYYQIADDMHLRLLERQMQGVEVLLKRLREGRESAPPGSERIGGRFKSVIGFYEDLKTKLLEMRARAEDMSIN
jgi:biotin operon repressor